MLKIEKTDRPVVLALLAIALSLWMTAGISFAESNKQPNLTRCVAADQQRVCSRIPEPGFWERTVTDPISAYTAVLALFTVVLAATSGWQGWLTWRTINLARAEFIATHRPRLRVRSIMTDGLGGATFVTVANVGESQATINGIKGIFSMKNRIGRWLTGLPGVSDEKPPPEEYRHFQSGERHTFLMPMDHMDGPTIIEIDNGAKVLFAVGAICYADGNGLQRRTGFCWPYDPASSQFFDPEKTTDFNYED